MTRTEPKTPSDVGEHARERVGTRAFRVDVRQIAFVYSKRFNDPVL